MNRTSDLEFLGLCIVLGVLILIVLKLHVKI